MPKRFLHVEEMLGACLILGVLAVVAWFAWSAFSTLPHTVECRAIRSEYLAADARVDRDRAEARFNAAGCKGSLLNTFLPAN